jgi:hypothetical protein
MIRPIVEAPPFPGELRLGDEHIAEREAGEILGSNPSRSMFSSSS